MEGVRPKPPKCTGVEYINGISTIIDWSRKANNAKFVTGIRTLGMKSSRKDVTVVTAAIGEMGRAGCLAKATGVTGTLRVM
jgi:hypothetical protein